MSSKHAFVTLDALRGIAALGVAVTHMPRVFDGVTVPNAHLAVDFFFQLSGFVIAFAYLKKIEEGMSLGTFVRARVNRLYPIFLVGILLGVAVAVAALAFGGAGMSVSWSGRAFGCAVLPNLLMLPAFGCGVDNLIFPFNPPMWSVFHEFLVNIAFFLLIPLLRFRLLVLCLPPFLYLLLAPFVLGSGGFDFGFGWGDFLPGFLRTAASFLVGVNIFLAADRRMSSSNLVGVLLAVVTGAALYASHTGLIYESVMVVVVFPLVVWFGARYNPSHAGLAWLFVKLGSISYVLYAIHKPTYQLLYGALLKFAPSLIGRAGMALGVAMLAGIVLLSWWLARYYEPAARALLGKVGAARRAAPASAE
ncbi:hypothetical protein BKK81_06545 [Cupriavidus sp. USMAHM13]|uniref:Acyltransferase 3 domain-containing protein n=1 Tax=Cupriavidus malaysiensis TaxID=367825 RepID=A0ABN4TGS7_9BURK|nr:MULTISPECIES: acyltransferase [Cupriavidus]AOY98954.1 hypothetical protein BKK81_06545 [Cupriavidus sp. USMAHM13]AOZ05379.1 hypothetical protein BKK80_05840 [Cupriavidus malaysiensis]